MTYLFVVAVGRVAAADGRCLGQGFHLHLALEHVTVSVRGVP
jgi:hypothetical protein